jgi:WD40 repeat protein
MGGLLIKRAYILAKQKKEFQSIAERTRAIFFLATPHRGSDLAQLLSKILSVTSGPRPFVEDLHRNSLATQSINDEFPQYCQALQLFSFYETQPTKLGLNKTLVVDKDLATLGYANERTAYLNATHRDVCKYEAPTDPNYQTVRNALASSINVFRTDVIALRREVSSDQQRLVDSFLGVSDAPEDDFMDIDALRMRGSCEWLLNRIHFHEWQDGANTQMYWITAKPATGKTILSGKIIHHLKSLARDLAFYFFDYRDNSKTTISSFLLSIAWQMTRIHPAVLQTVLDIRDKDDHLHKSDHRTIWRKLFVEGIFKANFVRPQYWVIDALDECRHHDGLVPLLLKAVETGAIRIFITSRDHFEPQSHATHFKARIIPEDIQASDTKSDIKLYLEANMDNLPSTDEEGRQEMVTKILMKSNGCFLWVRLILQELRQVHTAAEIRQVLEDIPSDMTDLYARILDSMSTAPYGKKLAKAILVWTVCSARSLSTGELYHALELDIKDKIDNIERAIESSCGQLVYVDQHSRVQIVHQTAREFLLRYGGTSEFAIDGKEGHKKLLMTCLQYLSGNDLKGPIHRKLSASSIVQKRSPFVAYACNSFYEHLFHVRSTDDAILLALAKFLKSSNVLSWIEYIAESSTLTRLIQAGKAFRDFLQRRSRSLVPLGKEVSLLDSWSIDLVRLVTKFGKNLTASPTSIFHLIPPFCPPESAPRRFASTTRGIAVLGLSATRWDDCLSTISHAQEKLTALACGNKYFAVGEASGRIVIYNDLTCQEFRTLQHLEAVRILQFATSTNLLASTGLRVVRMWDTTAWMQLWKFDVAHLCMSIAFMENEQLLLGALRSNQLMVWDLETGCLRDSADWTLDLEGFNANAFRRPVLADFCVEQGLLAILYRGQDIILWDLERDALREIYCKETGARPRDEAPRTSAGAVGLKFSLAPTATLLAVSYADGDLVLFDTYEGIVLATTVANAQTLASSADGRTLACGNSSGTIQLFDFETLKLLYNIKSEDYGIQALAFSGDSHRLLDIRGTQCRVWDPTVLVREDSEEVNSDTVSVSTMPQEVSMKTIDDVNPITSLACHKAGHLYFCGKEDGSIYVYDSKSGRQAHRLCSHADGVSILSLSFDEESNFLCSTDNASRIIVHRLMLSDQHLENAEVVFDHLEGVTIDQVLMEGNLSRLLVCTAEKQTLWSMDSNEKAVINSISWEDRTPYRWATHPGHPSRLVLITRTSAHIYDWHTLERLTSDEGILLEGSVLPDLAIRCITPCSDGAVIATAFSEVARTTSASKLLLWNASDFSPESRSAAPVPRYQALADEMKFLIGNDGQRVIFLQNSGWVCSASMQSSVSSRISRHFFFPADWMNTNTDLLCAVTRNGDILFVKHDEVAVIKRGLQNVEPERNAALGKRPSLQSKYK